MRGMGVRLEMTQFVLRHLFRVQVHGTAHFFLLLEGARARSYVCLSPLVVL